MSEPVIRAARESDLARICEIELECFSDPWSRGMFASLMNNDSARLLVADIDGEVCAFAGVYIIDGTSEDICGDAELADIAVANACRRKGFAKMLIHELFELAREHFCSAVFLEHRDSNIAAHELYKSMGFETMGKRKNYYASPREDAVLMKKELAASAAL